MVIKTDESSKSKERERERASEREPASLQGSLFTSNN